MEQNNTSDRETV